MTDFRNRVLGVTRDLVLDLIYEHFRPGRISGMVKNGEITVDEIAEEFKQNLASILEDGYEECE